MSTAAISFALRCALCVIFTWSGASKIRRPASFAESVHGFGISSTALATPIAAVVIISELFVALGLAFDATARLAAVVAISLLLVFAIALSTNLARGNRIPCNCFGNDASELVSPASLMRVIGIIAAATVFLVVGPKWPAVPTIVPALTVSGGAVLTVRLIGLTPASWKFLRATPTIRPTPVSRVSLKHQPLTMSLPPRISVPSEDFGLNEGRIGG